MRDKIKNFFKNCAKDSIYRAYLITIIFIIGVFVLGTLFENNKWLHGNILSDYMATCFEAHARQEWSVGYFLYYFFLYVVIIPTYLIPSLYLLAKKNAVGWLSYVIFLNIVFYFL